MKPSLVAALIMVPSVILGADGRNMSPSEKIEYMRLGRQVAQVLRNPPAPVSQEVVPAPDVVQVMGPNLPNQAELTPLPIDPSESSSEEEIVVVPVNYTINIKNSHGKVKILNSPSQSPNALRRNKKTK